METTRVPKVNMEEMTTGPSMDMGLSTDELSTSDVAKDFFQDSVTKTTQTSLTFQLQVFIHF